METELKFQVPRGRRMAVQAALATPSARTTRLQAVYVETAGRHLAAAGLALRLRQEGRVWVQTLKGRGDGLMSRLEHEVMLPAQRGRPALDLQRHAGTPAGELLAAALPAGAVLQTLYRTDIRRLHRRVRTGGAVVEIAYDRGWLLAGRADGQPEARLAVNEVEFELISGPASALPACACRWALRHGLWWDCRTKSERGMRLALGLTSVPAVDLQPARPAGFRAWQRALVACLLVLLANGAEIASGSHRVDHGVGWDTALAQLQRLLQRSSAAASQAAPARALAGRLAAWRGGSAADPADPVLTGLLLAVLALSLQA
jgi:inorganic triphosphatase YgiF